MRTEPLRGALERASPLIPTITLVAGVALWGQLVLVPYLVGAPLGALAMAFAAAALLSLAALPRLAARGLTPLLASALLAFPAFLALCSLSSSASVAARFDVIARTIGAITAIVYGAASLRWAEALRPSVPTTLRDASASPRSPAPRLHRAAVIGVALVGFFLAVVAPSILSSRAVAARSERSNVEAFLRAREVSTSAVGLCLALIVVLGAGPSLLRGKGLRPRRDARALAGVVWAAAFGALWWWVERARLG